MLSAVSVMALAGRHIMWKTRYMLTWCHSTMRLVATTVTDVVREPTSCLTYLAGHRVSYGSLVSPDQCVSHGSLVSPDQCVSHGSLVSPDQRVSHGHRRSGCCT